MTIDFRVIDRKTNGQTFTKVVLKANKTAIMSVLDKIASLNK